MAGKMRMKNYERQFADDEILMTGNELNISRQTDS